MRRRESQRSTWRNRAEPRSKVTFEIEPVDGELVKPTVVHDGFAPGSAGLESISQGWPRILAELKTLLESQPATPGTSASFPVPSAAPKR
jgi:hypothetical protein